MVKLINQKPTKSSVGSYLNDNRISFSKGYSTISEGGYFFTSSDVVPLLIKELTEMEVAFKSRLVLDDQGLWLFEFEGKEAAAIPVLSENEIRTQIAAYNTRSTVTFEAPLGFVHSNTNSVIRLKVVVISNKGFVGQKQQYIIATAVLSEGKKVVHVTMQYGNGSSRQRLGVLSHDDFRKQPAEVFFKPFVDKAIALIKTEVSEKKFTNQMNLI